MSLAVATSVVTLANGTHVAIRRAMGRVRFEGIIAVLVYADRSTLPGGWLAHHGV
jgi:hypothetical protein